MSEYILIHSRTPGSRNGVRRYQYVDGTWTEEGKRRRRAEYESTSGGSNVRSVRGSNSRRINKAVSQIKDNSGNRKSAGLSEEAAERYDRAFKPGKDGKASQAEKIARNSKDAVDAAGRLARRASKKSKEREDLSQMSDAELRAKINRLRMEDDYYRLSPEKVSKGSQVANEIIDDVGDMLAITSSAVAIIAAIYAIKKG